MKMKYRIDKVLLFSGGMDCYIAWRLLHQPTALFFNLGHRYAEEEQAHIESIRLRWPECDIRIIETLRMGKFEDPFESYIPYRNLAMLLWAHQIVPAHAYVIGQVREWQTDKNRSFYGEVESIYRRLGKRPARILAPLARYSKTEAVRLFIARGFDPVELTTFTRSCIQPGLACGRCANCIYRFIAFRNNGLSEKMEHEPTPADFVARLHKKGLRFWLRHPHLFLSQVDEAWRAYS